MQPRPVSRWSLSWATIFEIVVLVNWALFLGRPLLKWGRSVLPPGGDFVVTNLNNNTWHHARDCGTCALWNGDIRGGAPAFVDTLSAVLHPIVIVTTLAWGFVDGAKVAYVAAFALAGFGQWWLGRVLGLGRIARLWGAMMAMTAGYMFAPISEGLLPIVLANASFTLLFAALVVLARSPKRFDGPLVAASAGALALLIVSGQGYTQIGFALIFPLFAILLVDRNQWRPRLTTFAVMAGIGLLLAGPLLVPLIHHLPDITKPYDIDFSRAQSFADVPLNLVITDWGFYRSDILGKAPFPGWYMNYVGWGAIGLALFGVTVLVRKREGRLALFLCVYIIAAFWVASASPYRLVADHLGWSERVRQVAMSVRTPSLCAGLAIPPLLGLASVGLDRLLRAVRPEHQFRVSLQRALTGSGRTWVLDYRPIVVVVALLVLWHGREIGTEWLVTQTLPQAEIDEVVSALTTDDLQWVQPPYGESTWMLTAVERNLKIAYFHRPWDLRGKPDPVPVRAVSADADPTMTVQSTLSDGLVVSVAPPGREYAAVTHPDGSRTVCVATGEGGEIDVTCDAAQGGLLVVQEHDLSGWQVQIDGSRQSLADDGPWLAVEVPAGQSNVQFRYRPWDVPVGIGALVVGIICALICCVWSDGVIGRLHRHRRTHAPETESALA